MTKHGPLLAALVLFWTATGLTLTTSLARNEGHFVYALDDTYIHMVVSGNVAEHGVWGIDGREFASCSSSPLWTLLLAGVYLVAGAHAGAPFVLALLFATAILVLAHAWLRSLGTRPGAAFVILLAITFATPLVTLVFVANEHAMHALLTLALAGASVRALSSAGPQRGATAVLGALAALTVGSRYEGLFAVAVVAALLAWKRRWPQALAVAVAGGAAVVAFGLWSVSQGGHFLPNSVLMKAKYPWLGLRDKVLAHLGPSVLSEAIRTPELAILVLSAAAFLGLAIRRGSRLSDPPSLLLAIFVATALLHMDFARTGEFFRYEAYLVALGTFAAGAAVAGWGPDRKILAVWAASLLLGAPLAARAVLALRDTPVATTNIYEQQFQTASFLRDHYRGSAVAVNDIGLVSWIAGVRCVDLWGLANGDVATARSRREYGPETIRAVALAEGADVAVVYDRWFERFGGLPDSWVRVGQWTISNNVACGSPVVSFWATREDARARLEASLRAFSPRLPVRVRQSGAYLEER